MTTGTGTAAFSVAEAREVVKDLFEPRPLVYWVDLLASLVVGGAAFAVAGHPGPLAELGGVEGTGGRWALAGCAFVLSCLALYRAATFTHELAHLPRGRVRGFRVAWNLLVGIPFLMPSFLYETHLAHHRTAEYGSRRDGEYVPFARRPARAIVAYLATSFLVPPLAVARFLVLAPLSWASPGIARLVHRRASALVIDPGFHRPPPTRRQRRQWWWQEAGCFVVTLALVASITAGVGSGAFLVQAYLTGVAALLVNALRTLGAHRYRHGEGGLSVLEQVLDSVNYARAPLVSSLWGPLGMRFHALHHLFPSLPYHALGAAHRRLMARLPPDSPYRLTEAPRLSASLRQLWRAARGSA